MVSSLHGNFDILGFFSRQGMDLDHFLCLPASLGYLGLLPWNSTVRFASRHTLYKLGPKIKGSKQQREAVSSVGNELDVWGGRVARVSRASRLSTSAAGRPSWFTCAQCKVRTS